MKLKDLLNKSKNLSITRLSIKIVFTVLVIFATLTISLSNNFEFINTTLPTWLTAVGTVGAVGVAVGQTVIHNRKTEKEYAERSTNARKFINALLSTHKMYFDHYHSLRYVEDNVDIINYGELGDLMDLHELYLTQNVLKRAHQCLDDIKFGIKNVGIQTDSATINALSEQINAINLIETALSTINDQIEDYRKGYLDPFLFEDGIRNDLRVIDVSLQDLARDLTDNSSADEDIVLNVKDYSV